MIRPAHPLTTLLHARPPSLDGLQSRGGRLGRGADISCRCTLNLPGCVVNTSPSSPVRPRPSLLFRVLFYAIQARRCSKCICGRGQTHASGRIQATTTPPLTFPGLTIQASASVCLHPLPDSSCLSLLPRSNCPSSSLCAGAGASRPPSPDKDCPALTLIVSDIYQAWPGKPILLDSFFTPSSQSRAHSLHTLPFVVYPSTPFYPQSPR